MPTLKNETEADKITTKDLVVYMPDYVRERIRGWINACPTECGGLGTIALKDDKIIIDNVYIFKQIGSAGYFRTCNKDRGKFDMGLLTGQHELLQGITAEGERPEEEGEEQTKWDQETRKARQDVGENLYGRMQFHWHSHVNMGVFWSSTDVGAADDMILQHPWAIMLVSNKQGNTKTKLISRKPRFILDDLKLKVVDTVKYDPWKEIKEQCKKETEELVLPMSKYTYDEDKDEVVEATFPKNVVPVAGGFYERQGDVLVPGSTYDATRWGRPTKATNSGLNIAHTALNNMCLACHHINPGDLERCEKCEASISEPDTGLRLANETAAAT